MQRVLGCVCSTLFPQFLFFRQHPLVSYTAAADCEALMELHRLLLFSDQSKTTSFALKETYIPYQCCCMCNHAASVA